MDRREFLARIAQLSTVAATGGMVGCSSSDERSDEEPTEKPRQKEEKKEGAHEPERRRSP